MKNFFLIFISFLHRQFRKYLRIGDHVLNRLLINGKLPSQIRIHYDHTRYLINLTRGKAYISGWAVNLSRQTSVNLQFELNHLPLRHYLVEKEDAKLAMLSDSQATDLLGFAVPVDLPKRINLLTIKAEIEEGRWEIVKKALLLDIYPCLPKIIHNGKRQLKENEEMRDNIRVLAVQPIYFIFVQRDEEEDCHIGRSTGLENQIYANFREIRYSGETNAFNTIKQLSCYSATEGYIIFLEKGQTLCETALYDFSCAINQEPGTQLIYGDEILQDKGEKGIHCYKPSWSPDYLETFNYIGSAACYKYDASMLSYDFDCLYDFILQITEVVSTIKHIRKNILIHRSDVSDDKYGISALEKRLERTGRQGKVKRHNLYNGCFELDIFLNKRPLVSIVVIDDRKNISVNSDYSYNIYKRFVETAEYTNINVILVTDQTSYKIDGRNFETLVTYDCLATESELLYKGAQLSGGEYLVYLSFNLINITPGWLRIMMGHFQKSRVGAVGGKIVTKTHKTSNVGLTCREGEVRKVRTGKPADEEGYFFSTCGVRNYLAVSSLFMMTRTGLAKGTDGISLLGCGYHDMDYGCHLYAQGFNSLYEPKAVAEIDERNAREISGSSMDAYRLQVKWPSLTFRDPFWRMFKSRLV